MTASQKMRCRALVEIARARSHAVRQEALNLSCHIRSESDRRMTGVLRDAAAEIDRIATIVQSMIEPAVRKARPRPRRASEAA